MSLQVNNTKVLRRTDMPIYVYKCSNCDITAERFLKIKFMDAPQHCYECGDLLQRVIQAPMVIADAKPYICPVTNKLIEGRKAHEENLKRTGCRVLEKGESEEFRRRKQKEEENFDREIDTTVDKVLAKMPERQIETLVNEVASGIDVAVTRQ